MVILAQLTSIECLKLPIKMNERTAMEEERSEIRIIARKDKSKRSV